MEELAAAIQRQTGASAAIVAKDTDSQDTQETLSADAQAALSDLLSSIKGLGD